VEIEVDKLKSQGKTPSEIADALKVKYPVLTRQKVAKIIDKLRKRKRRGNGPK
jgi:DNA-binding CsgD family transcriptional regulator